MEVDVLRAHDMGFGCRREKQRIPNSKNITIIRTVRRRLGSRREQSETSECFHFDYDRSFFDIDTIFLLLGRTTIFGSRADRQFERRDTDSTKYEYDATGNSTQVSGGYIITIMITSIYVGMMSRVGVVPNVRPEMPRRRLTLRGPRVVMAPHRFLS